MSYKCIVECDACHDSKIEWNRTMSLEDASVFAISRSWRKCKDGRFICPRCSGREKCE